MKKLILKSLVFILPFFVIYFISYFFYLNLPGDLIRTGYILSNANYEHHLTKDLFISKKFTLVSELSKSKKRKFKILTIGDSFSNQLKSGYNDYLASNGKFEVLNLDGLLNANLNPIQSVVNMLNGDFLDSVSVDYVMLQVVERQSVIRTTKDTLCSLNFEYLITKKLPETRRDEISSQFFSNTGLKLIQTNIEYLYNQKPTFSKTFRVPSSKELFENKPMEILFFEDDLLALESNNDKKKIDHFNSQLNTISRKLKEKNIRLIVLICPDKYDFYYNFFKDKSNFPKPYFFNEFSKLEKEYVWLNANELLSRKMNTIKDLYYYEDSHWSTKSAKLVGIEIGKIISNYSKVK